MPFDAPGKQKHIKAVTLSNQERIVLASEKTSARLLIVDFFRDVLTAAVNADSRGFLQKIVLSLRENNSDKLITTLEEAKTYGGISKDCAVDAYKIIEHLIGHPPKYEGLGTEQFCKWALEYIEWKKDNDGVMMQLFRDAYVHDRGLKKGILLEVSMEAGSLVEVQEESQAKQSHLDPRQNITTFILENLKMYSEVEQDKLEDVKNMMRSFWPGLTDDLTNTDLFRKLDGKLDKADKDQVYYWNGYLGVTVTGENENKPLWFDCLSQDRTKEASAKREKDDELLMDHLNESHLSSLLSTEDKPAQEQLKPDDSKVFYGAVHKVNSREPIRLQDSVKIIDLKTRITYDPPKPAGRLGKVDYYKFIYPVLPDYNDPQFKQVLGFNELLVGSFLDEKNQSDAYFIVRTRNEFESLVKAYKLEKLRVCEYDATLKNALPANVTKDLRNTVIERTRTFLSQNRGKIPAILAALKAGKANDTVAALMEYVKVQMSPDGRLAYDLRNCLKKVISAKQDILPAKQTLQAQQALQDKLMIQTQNEIKTNQTLQRIQAFKAKLALQVKQTLQAKKALDVQVAPLFELVSQAYQARQLQPKPPAQPGTKSKALSPPKAAPPAPPALPWETVIPWDKLTQLAENLAEKAKLELPDAKIVLILPETNKNITDRLFEDLITFFYDFMIKAIQEPVAKFSMVMAESLADYLSSLEGNNQQQMMDALARLAEEMSPGEQQG